MENAGDLVSIVIPTYNRSNLLQKAISSLQTQTYQNIEIIIVDDCSSDDTEEVVRNMKDARIHYIKHEMNKGGSEARNTGLRQAGGKFIGFLDSDDQWLPEKLEKQLSLFKKNPSAGVVYTGVQVVNGDKVIETVIPQYKGDLLPKLFEGNCLNTTSSILVKKELLIEVGGFDGSLPSCQDWDLYIRLALITKFDFVKEPLVLFFEHDGERITTNKPTSAQGHMLIFLKYKETAKQMGNRTFQRFIFYISKIILKIGIGSQSKAIIKLARKVLAEGVKARGTAGNNFLYYLLTFVNLKILLIFYKKFGNSYQKEYALSEAATS
ncbi:glycosyltransferase family 2 protein [Planococcus salinarum]|uniref:glycosyltransferase family 2 protein n=1 Tax=Planococcus salinarum TaxID=622695 RepID=UPI000E3DA7FD|nr:glycosyltransferase family A protein [Planococcus salinarum]TAA72296.1 glycosyltransferase family 2 protein [Planococcus salinarum]